RTDSVGGLWHSAVLMIYAGHRVVAAVAALCYLVGLPRHLALFPYTTLFRSGRVVASRQDGRVRELSTAADHHCPACYRIDRRAGRADYLVLVLAIVAGRVVVAVATVSGGPEIGAGRCRQVAARIGPCARVVAAVAAHRYHVGVHRHMAWVVQREGNRTGRVVAS